MKILLLSKYSRIGASSRLRALQFYPYLKDNGHEVVIECLFDDEYLHRLYKDGTRSLGLTLKLYFARFLVLLRVRNYDVVWIEKEIFPYVPALAERILSALKIPYVVGYDDAIFHNYDLSASYVVRKTLSRKIDVVMKKSSCVVAGNKYLASRAVRAGAANVVVVPTVVDSSRYKRRLENASGKFTIGWIGSPSTQKYVVGIKEALINVSKLFDLRLVLMGATPDVVFEFQGMDVETMAWTEDGESAFIQGIDVGIMPLEDGPWEKGKCGYKLIQYMACSVPVIATPVGVNIEIVSESKCGFLASDIKEWEFKLSSLLGDKALRSEFGRAGREAVDSIYSLAVQAPRVVKALEDATFT